MLQRVIKPTLINRRKEDGQQESEDENQEKQEGEWCKRSLKDPKRTLFDCF